MISRRNVLQGMGLLSFYGIKEIKLFGDEPFKVNKKRRLEKLEYFFNPPQQEHYANIELHLEKNKFVYIHPRNKLIRESALATFVPESLFEKITDEDKNSVYLAPRKYLDDKSMQTLKKIAENNSPPTIYPLWSASNSPFVLLGTVSLEPKSVEDSQTIIKYSEDKKLQFLEHNKTLNLMRFQLQDISEFVSPFEVVRYFLDQGKVKWCEPDFAIKIQR